MTPVAMLLELLKYGELHCELCKMDFEYDCADYLFKFSISESEDEMRAALERTHSENCPDCGQRAGWGYVT